MWTIEVDVVVVGGGPAGAATAYHLAKRGCSVVVCEKKVFPREKTCGDGLTPRAVVQLQEMGLDTTVGSWQRIEGLRVHLDGRSMAIPFSSTGRWPGYGVVRTRAELDQVVLRNAEAAGVRVLMGAEALEPIFRDGIAAGVRVKHASEVWETKCSWIVCAEGGATKFARKLGRSRDPDYPSGFALRQYFRSSAPPSPWFDTFLTVRRGREVIPGYGWAFPVAGGQVNAGVGFLFGSGLPHERDAHALQGSFVKAVTSQFALDAEGTKVRGGRLFSGASVWPPHGPGFVLVGDAAGMINPFSGEGIAYAYETGQMAARHIADALRVTGAASLPGYSSEILDTYGAYYRLGRSFARLMNRPGMLERLASSAMCSDDVMSLVAATLLNLDDDSRWLHRVGIRLLKRLGP